MSLYRAYPTKMAVGTATTTTNVAPSEGVLNATDEAPLWKDGISMFLSVVLSLIIVTSIVGNLLELVVILRSRRMRTKTNIFIANLAVADLGVTVLCMPFSLVTILAGDYIFNMAVCNINSFCDALFLVASIHGLLGVSIQKYFALVKPLSGAITRRRITYIIAGAWVLAFFTAIGPVLGWTDTVYKPGASQCGPKYPETIVEYLHGFYNMLVALVIPLSVFIFVYTSVYIATRRHSKRLKKNTTYGEEHIFRQRIQIAKTIFFIVVAYLFLWSPYFIYASWILLGNTNNIPVWFNTFAYMCGYANSALNPVIYGLRTRSFRRELKRMFGFKSVSSNQSEARSVASAYSFKPTLDHGKDRVVPKRITSSQSIAGSRLINTLINSDMESMTEERLLETYKNTFDQRRTNDYQEVWVDLVNNERLPNMNDLQRKERVLSAGLVEGRNSEEDAVRDLMSYWSCPTGVPEKYVDVDIYSAD